MTDRVLRIKSKGGFAFEVEGVLARLSKKQSQKVEAWQVSALRAGTKHAADVRNRVSTRGMLGPGDSPVPFARKSRVVISPAYAKMAGAEFERNKNEELFHRRVGSRTGTYRVTGGMWSGVQVRIIGREIVIEFAGSSEGRGKVRSRDVAFTEKGRNMVRRELYAVSGRVTNRDKARLIHMLHRINPLAPFPIEIEAIGRVMLASEWAAVRKSL